MTYLETPASYSIVLNLLGVDSQDISIRADESKRELAVLARKDSEYMKRGFYWIFNIPSDASLESVSTRYKGGVLEILIPREQWMP